jgi:hypothetical protein
MQGDLLPVSRQMPTWPAAYHPCQRHKLDLFTFAVAGSSHIALGISAGDIGRSHDVVLGRITLFGAEIFELAFCLLAIAAPYVFSLSMNKRNKLAGEG